MSLCVVPFAAFAFLFPFLFVCLFSSNSTLTYYNKV